MARTIKNRLTTEERRAQAEALQGSIAEQVEQLRTSEQWLAFLRFAQSFHHYSLGNLLLILNQCPTATRVAGFRQWQGKGRQVRKGERAIRIFGYSRKTITPETDRPAPAAEAETTEDSQRTITYYPVLSVFDIGQTNPTDPDADDPSTPAHRLTGDDQLGILDAVTNYLTQRGWTVEREQISGSANGYTDPTTRRVAIDDHLSPAHAAKTALHEAAHVILHAEQSPNDYVEHRAITETEAESVAYVVAGLLGVDTSRYSIGYVAGWSAADADTIKTTATPTSCTPPTSSPTPSPTTTPSLTSPNSTNRGNRVTRANRRATSTTPHRALRAADHHTTNTPRAGQRATTCVPPAFQAG